MNTNKPVNGFDKRPQDINRTGRPPSYFNGMLKDMGVKVNKKTGLKYKRLLVKRLWTDAINGNIMAAKEIMNRIDGMPHQTSDITSDGERIEGLVIYRPERDEKKNE